MFESYYRINKAAGVSINTRLDGSTEINACEIIINHNKLDIQNKIVSINDIKPFCDTISTASFISLNISGKNVLQKQTTKIEEVNENNFSRVIPNVNFKEFYVQNFISGDYSYVSIIRQSEADKWINTFKEHGYHVLMLSLGVFPSSVILPQMNIYGQEVIFDGHVIQRDNSLNWIKYTYDYKKGSQHPLKIDTEAIDQKLIIPYAAAFQMVFSESYYAIKANAAKPDAALINAKRERKLKINGIVVIVSLFSLLLINFLLLTRFNRINNELSEKIVISDQGSIDVQKVYDQVKQKEALLSELGWDAKINTNILLDQLASIMPEELTLTGINVNPVNNEASELSKRMIFNDHEIVVTGNSEKIIPVNEWIARLKTRHWVKSIQLQNYIFDNNNNQGDFRILINY